MPAAIAPSESKDASLARILHIIATADPRSGGPIEGARRLGEIWAADGHVQDLLTLDAPAAPFLAAYSGRVIALGRPGRRGRTPWARYGYAPGMIGWLRAHATDYDAVIVAGLWNYTAMAARFGLIGGKAPYFVYTHGMLDPWFARTYPLKNLAKQLFWLFNEGPLLRHARAVLFTTEDERLLAANAFRPYRLHGLVVGYGTADAPDEPDAQHAAFGAAVPALAGRRFLLFLSRIHPKKGCDLLIDAFAGIAAVAPDLDLVIAGPDQVGMRAALAAQAERRGIAARVHFPGMLEGAAKWGAFRACEAFALTSHQENFGVVVAEAMACAKPVLITDKVNIWREVEAVGGGLVEPDTAAGAARLLARFEAMSPAERAAMCARARTGFLERFRIEEIARRLMTVLCAQADPSITATDRSAGPVRGA